jgi:hypothetical protein
MFGVPRTSEWKTRELIYRLDDKTNPGGTSSDQEKEKSQQAPGAFGGITGEQATGARRPIHLKERFHDSLVLNNTNPP